MDETTLFARRCHLRFLQQRHPGWSKRRLARRLGMSEAWVRKWLARIKNAPPDDQDVLFSRSRRPKRVQCKISPELEVLVLQIRDDPPDGLKRTPGCDCIHYYLAKAEAVKTGQLPLICPKSINRILHKHQRIAIPAKVEHDPLVQAEPMTAWQIDFKDVTTVKAAESDKKMHLVETLNIVDSGTSILVDNPVRNDFNAETALLSLVDAFRHYGVPNSVRFDRDPRFVTSASGRDFPSPLIRFLHCLGVEPLVCPPRQPWKNPYVERLNRTYKYEGVLVYLPESLSQTKDMNLDFRYHYNYQRPNQAITCHNQPPRLAFAELPSLPQLPETIDPDRWLYPLDGQAFIRRINANGSLKLDKHHYYVQAKRRGQYVTLQLQAHTQSLLVFCHDTLIKTLPVKGLIGHPLPFQDYLDLIRQQAVSEWRAWLRKKPRRLPVAA